MADHAFRPENFAFSPVFGRESFETAFASSQELLRRAGAAQAEWIELCQSQAKRAVEGVQTLSRCRDVTDGLAVQADMMKGMLEAYADGTQRIMTIWTETAQHAAAAAAETGKAAFREAAE